MEIDYTDILCIYCNTKNGCKCENTRCVLHGTKCNSYHCEQNRHRSKDSAIPKRKKWRKVKTMEDTYYDNAKFY